MFKHLVFTGSVFYRSAVGVQNMPHHPPKHEQSNDGSGTECITFGKSLSQKLDIPFYETILLKKTATKTQTKKLRLERWKNSEHKFTVQTTNTLNGKHILLIDDIITTGATLEACVNAFKDCKNIKISIATMAYTQ